MAKYIYRPFRDSYRATLCGHVFGPEDGQIKPGGIVEMDPSDDQFVNWNEHVSGADGGPCFVLVDDNPAPPAKPARANASKVQPAAPADPSAETT